MAFVASRISWRLGCFGFLGLMLGWPISHAATIDYANLPGANDFTVGANWVGGVAPGASDVATINGVDGVSNYSYLDTTRSIQRFTIATNNGHSGGLEVRTGGNL